LIVSTENERPPVPIGLALAGVAGAAAGAGEDIVVELRSGERVTLEVALRRGREIRLGVGDWIDGSSRVG
jgi:hypothetical protein